MTAARRTPVLVIIASYLMIVLDNLDRHHRAPQDPSGITAIVEPPRDRR
jgi:hypothetical protein